MKLRLCVLFVAVTVSLHGQQPHGVAEALQNLTSEHATHTAFTFDRDALQSVQGLFGQESAGALNSVTVENFRFHEPAFYIPESMADLVSAYDHAHWKHLVNQNAGPGQSATPTSPLTDLWLHYHGTEIDDVAVLIRGPKQMSLIEISGMLRPLDLIHLSGHFGIPKVDPNAVMVPAK